MVAVVLVVVAKNEEMNANGGQREAVGEIEEGVGGLKRWGKKYGGRMGDKREVVVVRTQRSRTSCLR